MYEVTLFFKSGNQMTFQCDNYEFTYNKASREYSSYKLEGLSGMVSFSPHQLEAYAAFEVK